MNKKEIFIIIIVFILSSLILVVGRKPYSIYAKVLGVNKQEKVPKRLYNVYLGGKSIGVINSKKELEDYIDSKKQDIKDKYNISKVYAPNDLKIVKEVTYNEEISSIEDIYNKIISLRGNSSFTIDGYIVHIDGYEETTEDGEKIVKEPVTLYVLDKDLFKDAVIKTIKAFIEEDTYNAYMDKTQKPLEDNDIGSIIDNIYISSKIDIEEGRIPIDDNIFTDLNQLSKYLLFGTLEDQEQYTVKIGDTIDDIANNNKLSVNEFLIANSTITSANDLLYPGQNVNLGLIKPQFRLVLVKTVKENKVIDRSVVYKNDSNQYAGYEKVEQEGHDGLSLVTTTLKIVNGQIEDTQNISDVEITPASDKVIVRGTKRRYESMPDNTQVPVDVGSWRWPTNPGYTISSPFSWRGSKHHDGVDIGGLGYGSPIKAANNGVVVQSNYNGYNGNWIAIKHSNGYYTYYGHLAKRYKQVGDVVFAGDIIGGMGQSGYATGVHLHFGLSVGFPYRSGSYWLNPMSLY